MPEIPRALVASIVAFACFVLLLVLATTAFQDVLPLSPWYWLVQVALLGTSVVSLLAWRLDVSIRDSIAIAVATSGVIEEEDEAEAPIEAMALDERLRQRASQPAPARPAAAPHRPATTPVAATPAPAARPAPAPAPAITTTTAPATPAKPASKPAAPATPTPASPPAFAPAGPPATPDGPRKTFKVSWKTVSLFIETYKEAGIGGFSLSKIRKDMGIDAGDEKKIARLKEMLVRASLDDLIIKKGNKHVIARG